MSKQVLFGFHAVTVRLKTAPQSVVEVHVDATRRDARMRQFVERAKEAGAKIVDSDDERLRQLCGTHRHQGVVARVQAVQQSHSLDDTLDAVEGAPLLLVLDGITDPHNLGACLRVADGAGAHAVIAPKDHAAGINATQVTTDSQTLVVGGTLGVTIRNIGTAAAAASCDSCRWACTRPRSACASPRAVYSGRLYA